jgi:hypothetical protein
MSEYYGIVRSGAEDILEHHGVLGMRWGIRHDRRVKAAKQLYKIRRKTIKKDKTLTKAQKQKRITASREEWMKERERAANRLYSLQDKETNRRVARMTSRGTIGKSLLMGSYGALKYTDSRAHGAGKFMSYARGSSAEAHNNAVGGRLAWEEYFQNRNARTQVKRKKK